MLPLKQSTAIVIPFFAHDASGDGVAGMVDGGWTKWISKNGAAFATMTVTITEMVAGPTGWYSFTLSGVHSDTLGIMSIALENGSCKDVLLQYRVHARLPDDHAFPSTSGNAIDVRPSGEVAIDYSNAYGTIDASTKIINLNDPSEASLVSAIFTQSLPASFAAGTAGYLLGQYIDASLSTIDTNVDSILTDTGELQTDWVNGGRLDLILDLIAADTNELQVDWTNGGRLDLLVDLILADTGELQTDWANGGRLDLLLDTAATENTTALSPIAVSLAGTTFTAHNILQALYSRFYYANTQTSNAQVTFSSSGDTFASRVTSDDGTTQTIQKAT